MKKSLVLLAGLVAISSAAQANIGGRPYRDTTFYQCAKSAAEPSFEGSFVDAKGTLKLPSGNAVALDCDDEGADELKALMPSYARITRVCTGEFKGKTFGVGLSNSMGNVQAHAVRLDVSGAATLNCESAPRPAAGAWAL